MIAALQYAEKSQTDVWKHCKFTSGTISHWISGATKKIEGPRLVCVAKYLGVNAEWLATGKGPMAAPKEPDESSEEAILIRLTKLYKGMTPEAQRNLIFAMNMHQIPGALDEQIEANEKSRRKEDQV